jgi:23S rRNA A2030 N6-methylase RlmJ
MGTDQHSKVRYQPGNLGDLLKHGWLVEIVRFLHRHNSGKPLRCADTFCGFPEYDIRNEMAERIRDRFHVLTFRRLQETFLDRGKYAGSVTLARLAAEGNLRASIFDSNPEALASFPSGEAEILEIRSGCDILDSKEPYDLIFLDPYDDIWDVGQSVLAKSAARHRLSSVLIFFPFKTEAQRDVLTTAVERLGVNCQLGFVMNPGIPQDGRYHFATVFLPGSSLNVGAVLGLFGELNIVTARVNALAADP